MKQCKNCKSPLEAGARFCEECGTPVLDIVVKNQDEKQKRNKKKICPKCHKLIEADATFCEECGNAVGNSWIKGKILKMSLRSWGITAAVVVIIIFVIAQIFNNDEIEQVKKENVEQIPEQTNSESTDPQETDTEETNTQQKDDKKTKWKTAPLTVSKHEIELYKNETGSVEFTGYSKDADGKFLIVLKFTGLLKGANLHGRDEATSISVNVLQEDGQQFQLVSTHEVRFTEKEKYDIYRADNNSDAKIIRMDVKLLMSSDAEERNYEETSVKVPDTKGTIEIAGTKNFSGKQKAFSPIERENEDMEIIINSIAIEPKESSETSEVQESLIISGEIKPKKDITSEISFMISQPQLQYFDIEQVGTALDNFMEGTTVDFQIETSLPLDQLSKDGVENFYFSIGQELYGINWSSKKQLKDIPLTMFIHRYGYGLDNRIINGFVDVEGERVYDATQMTYFNDGKNSNYYIFEIPVGGYKELSFRLGAGKNENTSDQPFTITVYGEDYYKNANTNEKSINDDATILFEEEITNKTPLKKVSIKLKKHRKVYLKVDHHENTINNHDFIPYPVIIEGMKASK